jgi:cell division protein FtsZ
VSRTPRAEARPEPRTEPRAEQAPRHDAPARDASGEKSRFGINSLINRMTGSGQEAQPAQPRPVRQQPTMQAHAPSHDSHATEEDEIEIPAFLRRQAN